MDVLLSAVIATSIDKVSHARDPGLHAALCCCASGATYTWHPSAERRGRSCDRTQRSASSMSGDQSAGPGGRCATWRSRCSHGNSSQQRRIVEMRPGCAAVPRHHHGLQQQPGVRHAAGGRPEGVQHCAETLWQAARGGTAGVPVLAPRAGLQRPVGRVHAQGAAALSADRSRVSVVLPLWHDETLRIVRRCRRKARSGQSAPRCSTLSRTEARWTQHAMSCERWQSTERQRLLRLSHSSPRRSAALRLERGPMPQSQ